MPSFAMVERAVADLRRRGWKTDELTNSDGYPVLAAEITNNVKDAPKLLIVAGIHGEEPGAVIGTVDWLLHHSQKWTDQIQLTVIPCVNPWGFERGIRTGPHGKDLNREFDHPKHAYSMAVNEYLTGKTFDLFMDQHEDSDFHTMYVYETPFEPQRSLARHILYVSEYLVPISHGEEVEPFVTDVGIVSVGDTDVLPPRLEGLPIAMWAHEHLTEHTVTVETPGMQPLKLRARIHVGALEEACHFLTRRHRRQSLSLS